MKQLHFFFTIIFIVACFGGCTSTNYSKDQNECILYFLEEFNMDPYDGEELACHTYIRLYEFNDTFFAIKDNYCADFAPFQVYDCDGEEFCITSTGPCHIQESTDLGIIGIEK